MKSRTLEALRTQGLVYRKRWNHWLTCSNISEYWLERGAIVKLRNKLSWGGRFDTPLCVPQDERIACPWAMTQLHVFWDGRVPRCPGDTEGDEGVGNAWDDSLSVLWQRLGAYRDNHMHHRFDDDDPARHGEKILGVEIAGPFGMLEHADPGSDEAANLVARTAVKRWSARCRIEDYGLPFATIISPGVDTMGTEFHRDIVVYQNATLGPLVSLDEGSVVFMGGIAGHGSKLGRCCIVAPNAVINARVTVGDGVYIGSNATILPEVKIGSWATIGAGAVVTQDVPAGATISPCRSKVVLTLDLKLKMGAFKCLPQELRSDLENLIHA
jgi:acetyltransferase-like isoleucine patch superfamily enzyme